MAWLADYWFLIVLLLVCVGMHFLHGGHGGHGKSGDSNDKHRH